MKLSKFFLLVFTSVFLCAFGVFADSDPLEYNSWLLGTEKVSFFSDREPSYISPNNDGIKDTLSVPMEIRESRYVVEWFFVVEDSKGNPVRVIKNQEKPDVEFSFRSFWKFMGSPRRSVDIPSQVVWNGIMNNGEVAPDGVYYYYATATDDNGNTGFTSRHCVIVDTTPPEINMKKYSSEDKIFGVGDKNSFSVVQDGSVEDEWVASFSNSTGKVVKEYKWNSAAPSQFEWDGTDNNGNPLGDGIFSYKITSTDRAGNSSVATISNIIFSSEKPSVEIVLGGKKYFSPNGDNKNDDVSFDLKFPKLNEKTGNRLAAWEVSILDKDENIVRQYSGNSENQASVVFDGKNDAGEILPDGSYHASVEARFLNGYVTDPVRSPAVVLDTKMTETVDFFCMNLFNPEENSAFEIRQAPFGVEASPVEHWAGKIVNVETGESVFDYEFGQQLPDRITWTGLTKDRIFAPDGNYRYVIVGTDSAGNIGEIQGPEFVLDTTATELLLTLKNSSFKSGEGKVVIVPIVKSGHDVVSHEISVMDNNSGMEVWSKTGKGLPSSFEWDGKDSKGKNLPEGEYVSIIQARATNDAESSAKSPVIKIDNTAPKVILSAPVKTFSPDGDGRVDSIKISADSSDEASWKAVVYNSSGKNVKNMFFSGRMSDFEWNGSDDSGNIVPDGNYKIVVSSTDEAGNFGSSELSGIKVDTSSIKVFVNIEEDAISPNSDGKMDSQKFTIKTMPSSSPVESWNLSVREENGNILKEWKGENGESLPSSIEWDGKDSDGKIHEGSLSAKLSVAFAKGNVVEVSSPSFVSSVTPPELKVTILPEYFSPDGDGENDELYIKLDANTHDVFVKDWQFKVKDPNGKDFWQASGKNGISGELVWDGRSNMGKKKGELVESASEYPYEFTVTDSLGMTTTHTGVVSTDILVVPEGNVLKLRVPSIIFRSDSADFGVTGEKDSKGKTVYSGITNAQKNNNEKILKRVVEVLNKFRNYTITVEGHANNVSGTEIEENQDTEKYGPALIPLSKKRAEFVMNELIKYGVEKSRLSAVGRGGTAPVAEHSDKDNWWKNRRVEFILNK